MNAMTVFIVFVGGVIWLNVMVKRHRVRQAYKFNPPKHGAAEWSTADDARRGGLL